jgi:hypothetical protein
MGQDSSVTGYKVNNRGSIHGRDRNFYLRYYFVQTASRGHPSNYPMDVGSYPWELSSRSVKLPIHFIGLAVKSIELYSQTPYIHS